MKNFGLALLLSALIPAVALAGGGGGGSKATSFIKVKNTSVLVLGVIVDPPGGAGYVIPATIDAFKKDGGKVLNAGETASFNAKEGNHLVGGAFINLVTGVIGPKGSLGVTVGKKATVNVEATDVGGTPSFTKK